MNLVTARRLQATCPDSPFQRVFDVGANVGQVVDLFLDAWPEARIEAFEPVPGTFGQLADRHGDSDRVRLHQMALGLTSGQVSMTTKRSKNNQILPDTAATGSAAGTVTVEQLKGDAFCDDQGIDAIDVLKIDAEGHDLEVLMGFTERLRVRSIRFIEVECTTSLDNRFHVHLERFIHALHPWGYRLWSLCDYTRRINRTRQVMQGIWYCNAIFVAENRDARLRRDGRN